MTTYDEQWRPIPIDLTGDNDALSLAAPRLLALGINNAKGYAMAHPWRAPTSFYQADAVGGSHRPWSVIGGTTDELVARYFAAAPLPQGYTIVRWAIGHRRTAGAGTITWRLYLSTEFWNGVDGTAGTGSVIHRVDTDRMGDYVVDSTGFVCNSDSHEMPAPRDIDVSDLAGRDVYGYLTAEASESGTTAGEATFFAAYPRLE